MTARRINDAGLEIIKQFEGLRLTAYLCPGVPPRPTIGWGHTRTVTSMDVRDGHTITREEAERLLREDLEPVEIAVAKHVRVPLTDNQFSALCSWAFNVGTGWLTTANDGKPATIIQRLNRGAYAAVPEGLPEFNRSGGRVLRGLTLRREAEANLWRRG